MSEVNVESFADEPKDFKCSYCGREFAVMRSLRRHENIHTGKLHRCQQCQKGFTDPWILRRHVMIHDRIAKVKPQPIHFNCNQCQRTFSSKRDLESHLCMFANKVVQKKRPILNNRKIMRTNLINEAMNHNYIPLNLIQYPESGSSIPGESINGNNWVRPQVSGQVFTQLGFVCQFCGVSFSDNLDWKLHEEQERIKISEAAWSNLASDDFIKNLVEGDNLPSDQGQVPLMDEGNGVEALVKQGNVVRKSVIMSVGRNKPQDQQSSPAIANHFYSVLSPPASLPSPSIEWMAPSPSSFLSGSTTSEISTAAVVFPSTTTELMASNFSIGSPPNSPSQSSLNYTESPSQSSLNYTESPPNSPSQSSLNYTESHSPSQSSLNYTESPNIKDQSIDTSSYYYEIKNNQWMNNNSELISPPREVKWEYDVDVKDYAQIKEENFSN